MEDKLKYRLVGAAVIIAIAAFFLPLILDSEKYRTEIVSQIPAMPQADKDTGQVLETEDNQPDPQNPTKSKDTGPLIIELDKKPQTASDETSIEKLVAEPISETTQPPVKDNTPKAVASENSNSQIQESAEVVPPEVKSVEQTKIVESDKPIAKSNAKPVETSELASEAKTKVVESTAPKSLETPKAPDFKEQAYVIQIGTFSNKANASKLVDDLRKQEYRAYQRVSDDFSRVYVGPYPEKSLAESRSSKLTAIVGGQVKVIEFDPIKH